MENSTPGWQQDSTGGYKTLEAPHLDSVLMYTPTGSTDSALSTPAESMESQSFEGRDRLLSRSPSKKPGVFTVSFNFFKPQFH